MSVDAAFVAVMSKLMPVTAIILMQEGKQMELNKENMKRVRGLIIFTVIALIVAVNYKTVFQFASTIFGIVFPFVLGGIIAFILNVPMRFIEKMLPLKKHTKLKRPVSLVLTLLLFAGVLFLVGFIVLPELVRTITVISDSVPVFWQDVQRQAEAFFANYPDIVDYISELEINWKETISEIMGFLGNGAGTVLSSTLSAARSVINGLTTFFIGFIFALYILLQKETLGRQVKKLIKAFLPDHVGKTALDILLLTEKTFSSFLTGQCMEAVILGMLFFITLTVMRFPYALLIGVLIGFTALIPIFGAFIGCVVGAFLILMVSPVKALIFVIVFLILQQLEGNLIYPHVVGNSVGLPSIWVLAAVTIGGSVMGIAGMLIFIPLCSVFYTLLKAAANHRIEQKEKESVQKESAEKEGEESAEGR